MNRVLRQIILVALFPAALLLGCADDDPSRTKDGGPDKDGTVTQGDGPDPNKTLNWVTTSLDNKKAGLHASIASGGGKIGVAYFHKLPFPPGIHVTCQPTFPGAEPTVKARPTQELYYVQHDGTDWGQSVKVDQTIGPPFGLSIAMDSAGKVHIGYLGGKEDAELSLVECSSSNARIASSADGATFSIQTIDTAGATGDTVGHWMSVAVDSSGTVHASHRDVHFGYYEQDGNVKASLRYDSTKVSGDNGSGVYSSLAFDQSDQPVIAHYKIGSIDGVTQIALSHMKGGAWTTQELVPGGTAERIELETDGKGTFGLVYYCPKEQTLAYIESTDLENWTEAAKVDVSLTANGQFSSLAYDSNGNPAISYYRCSDYGASKCNSQEDGLMFAYRIGGSWQTYEVDTGDAQYCGTYTSLTFDDQGQPVIAYKCVSFDNLTNEWVDTLKVAVGVWQ